MGLKQTLNNIRGSFSKEKTYSNPYATEIFFNSLREVLGREDQGATQPFVESTWVYASVSKIASNISNVPMKLYEPTTSPYDDKKEVMEHDILELLNNPNPYMTGQQLKQATQIYMGIRGEAIWILENRANVTSLPDRIWCFDPSRFEAVTNKESGMIEAWKYCGIKEYFFPVHQIVHFKEFNPYDDIRGLAPLVAAKAAVDQDYFANKFNLQFFKGGASISGFVELEDRMNDTQYARFKKQLGAKTEGVDQAHTIGILEGGATFKETKLSQKDMEYIQGKKVTRKEIFAVYGTNEVVLGVYEDIKSYEGIKTSHKVFWQETLIPKMGYMEDMINEKFVKPTTGRKYWLEFDLATVASLQEGYKEKVETGKGLQELGYPLNDINRRLDLGMQDVPWGNTWYHNINIVAEGTQVVEPAAADPNPEPVDTDDGTEKGIRGDKYCPPVLDGSQSKVSKGYDFISEMIIKDAGDAHAKALDDSIMKDLAQDERDVAIWEEYILNQRPIEKKFLTAVRGYFFKQRKRVLDSLFYHFEAGKSMEDAFEWSDIGSEMKEGCKASVLTRDLTDDIMDVPREEENLRKTVTPLYTIAVKEGVERLAASVGDADFIFDPLDRDYLAIMEVRIQKIPPLMVGTVKHQIRETLIEGIGSGESVQDLAERVREVYRGASNRALTIARTESGAAINGGRFGYMKKMGYKEHEWITAMDGKERASHAHMRNSIAKVGDHFRFVTGIGAGGFTELRYPGDMDASAEEVINCRCLTIPVIEGA